MSELRILSLGRANRAQIGTLLDAEEQAWLAELGWERTPVRRILQSYIDQNLLPGWATVDGDRLVGYIYFLVHDDKGIVGGLYSTPAERPRALAGTILARAIDELKSRDTIRRIEAQIMPLEQFDPAGVFVEHGFHCHHRYLLELDLAGYEPGTRSFASGAIVPWDGWDLERMSSVILTSYEDSADAEICEDYRSAAGCERYLRSLVENVGCGAFLPEGSFIAHAADGSPGGLIVASRIARHGAMLPQISVVPRSQGLGVGRALVDHSLRALTALGFRTVSLTVTGRNRRAFEWYERLGFRVRKEFGAYVWERGEPRQPVSCSENPRGC